MGAPYTSNTYVETNVVQPGPTSNLGALMLFNLDTQTPRVIATLATSAYHQMELRLGTLLTGATDITNLMLFARYYAQAQNTITLGLPNHITLLLQLIKPEAIRTMFKAAFAVQYEAQVLDASGHVINTLQINSFDGIFNNPFSTSPTKMVLTAL